MIARVAVEARLAALTVLARRAVQAVAAHARPLIAALSHTRVHIFIALAGLARAARLRWIPVIEHRAQVALEALVAPLAGARHHLRALVQGACARELIAAAAAAQSAWTHAFLARSALGGIAIVSVQTQLAPVAVRVAAAIGAHTSGRMTGVRVAVAFARTAIRKVPEALVALVTLAACDQRATLALARLEVAAVVQRALRVAVAFFKHKFFFFLSRVILTVLK